MEVFEIIRIRNKIILFAVILTLLALFVEILTTVSEIDYNAVMFIVRILVVLLFGSLLFDIGRAMENRTYRKRYIIYIVLVSSVWIVLLLISLAVSDSNNWFTLLGANLALSPFFIIAFDISKLVEENHEKASFTLRFIFYIGLAVLFFINVFSIFLS